MANINKWMIDPRDAVLLLIDHQSGLFQLVKDIELPVLRANVTALAKMAHLAKIPTITTASVPDGPNGPLIPEIHQCNPEAVYVPRTGQINAWDNPAWVKAIEQTRRKTLLLAGTLTSICMALPALSAVTAGYKVFCIIDASGNWSRMATDLTLARCPGRRHADRHLRPAVRGHGNLEPSGRGGFRGDHGRPSGSELSTVVRKLREGAERAKGR
jgi:nicotinamidase-related amidase